MPGRSCLEFAALTQVRIIFQLEDRTYGSGDGRPKIPDSSLPVPGKYRFNFQVVRSRSCHNGTRQTQVS